MCRADWFGFYVSNYHLEKGAKIFTFTIFKSQWVRNLETSGKKGQMTFQMLTSDVVTVKTVTSPRKRNNNHNCIYGKNYLGKIALGKHKKDFTYQVNPKCTLHLGSKHQGLSFGVPLASPAVRQSCSEHSLGSDWARKGSSSTGLAGRKIVLTVHLFLHPHVIKS